MIDLHDIRYLRIGTPDLEGAIRFATDIVGLQLVAREGKSAYFRSDKVAVRGDTRDHTLVYFEGDPGDQTIGFDLLDPDDLDKVGAELEKAGQPAHLGTHEECEKRRVRAFVASTDPTGNKIEIVARPYHSGVRYFAARDAGITGFSHIGLYTKRRGRATRRSGRASATRASATGSATPPLLRIATAHHSIALFPAQRTGVQHINHQVEDIDDVMKSWYFLRDKGVKILLGPGAPSAVDRGHALFPRAGRHGLRVFLRREAHPARPGSDLPAAPVRLRPVRHLHVGLDARSGALRLPAGRGAEGAAARGHVLIGFTRRTIWIYPPRARSDCVPKGEVAMAKYLVSGSYTPEGLKGLQKDKASGRRDAVAKGAESVGGKLDAVYYTLGQDDVLVIVDMPDIVSVAALAVAANASGLVNVRTTALMTVEETDRALAKSVAYRPPGR